MIPSVPSQIPPVMPDTIPPSAVPVSGPVSLSATTQIPQTNVEYDMSAMWRIPVETPGETQRNISPTWRTSGGSEIEEAASERMSAYLEDQSSISGCSHIATGQSMNELRTSEWVSEHGSVVSSWRPGSAAVSSPPGRADCGMPEGCGTEGSPVRFKIDLKPKDPPVFAGKGTDDLDIWVKQISNFLTIIGGPDHIQVAYVANLLQGVA